MTTYVYHYCASCQMEAGIVHRADGLVTRTGAVSSPADYRELMSFIAKAKGWPVGGFVLDSLSFLHQAED